jgi:cytochrome P450
MAQSLTSDLAGEARLDDPEFFVGDPYPTYARLRREAPVFWCESGQFWALAKHADVTWLEQQPNPPFTTTQGLFISEATDLERLVRRDGPRGGAPTESFMSDPPDHTRFRRIVGGAFSPTLTARLEPRIGELVSALLDRLPVGEPFDFMDAFAVPFPLLTIAEILGLPIENEDVSHLRRWSDAAQLASGMGSADDKTRMDQALEAMAEQQAYFADFLVQRREEPCDDLMSEIAAIEVDGERLAQSTQLHLCNAVMQAGNETTRNTLAGGMAAFAQYPDQWDKLRKDPALIPNATDEILRWTTPVIHFARRATQPVVIRDQQIADGEFVVMLYQSANRDEDVWEDGDTFDVSRSTRPPHLSFGTGLHSCIGAALARAQIRSVLDGLITRFSSWELAGPVERAPSTLTTHYEHVPIVLTGRDD